MKKGGQLHIEAKSVECVWTCMLDRSSLETPEITSALVYQQIKY